MKSILLLLLLLSSGAFAKYDIFPDTVAIGDNAKPEAGAALVVQSSTLMSLPCPKMTTTERNALAVKPTGGCIFNETTAQTEFWNGGAWLAAGSGAVISEWTTGVLYGDGAFVYTPVDFKLYLSNTSHTAGATFAGDVANWDEASSTEIVDLATADVTGILPIANGGTNSSTALNNSFVMISNAGAIEESANITVTELGYLNTVSANIQTQLDARVLGPASSTDNAIVRWDLATGKLTQNSAVIIDDTNNVTGIVDLTNSGDLTVGTQSTTTGMSYDSTLNRLSVAGTENTVTIAGVTYGSTISAHAEGATNVAQVAYERHSDVAALGAHLVYSKSRGTEDAEAIVQDGDVLSRVVHTGFDGTDYEIGAEVRVEVDGTPGAGDMPTRMVLSVTPDGSATPVEAVRINNLGQLGIGTNNPEHEIEVTGDIRIGYTATTTDNNAVEIDMDAAGFGGNEALDIDYITGALAAGSAEAAILVNIDETLSTGGDVYGIEVLATEGSATVYALGAGPTVNPIEQESGVFIDMDSALTVAVDNITAWTTSDPGGVNNVDFFVADNDTITFGDASKFEVLEFVLETGASQNVNPTFEYSTGIGTWATFAPVDGTSGFQNTGLVAWLDADIPTWATGTGTEYLIRITRTRNGLPTNPVEDHAKISAVSMFSWDKNGDLIVNDVTTAALSSTTGAFSDALQLDQIATPATPAASKNKLYFKSDDSLYKINSSGIEEQVGGGGQGGINYLADTKDSDFELSVGNWVAFDDGAVTVPVTGAGTASGNLTCTRNTTTPIRLTGDLKMLTPASDSQGEGCSVDFDIDLGMQAQKLTGSAWIDLSAIDDDDFAIFVYDKTNTNMIRVNGESLKGGEGKTYFQFQTASNSTSYRLIIMNVDSSNTTSRSLYFDQIAVGPTNLARGSIISDWKSYTPTGEWTTNTTYTGKYRRVGDSMELQVSLDLTGAPVGTFGYFNIPSGFSIDTSKLATPATAYGYGGMVTIRDTGAGTYHGVTRVASSGSIGIQVLNSSSQTVPLTATVPMTFVSGDSISLKISVPIQGWSSDSVSSEDLGGRSIVVEGAGNGGLGITLNLTPIDFTESRDTTASFDGSIFTAPESGDYQIEGLTVIAVASTYVLKAFVNGSVTRPLSTDHNSRSKKFSGTIYLDKGDTFSVVSDTTETLTNTTNHHIHIQKLASPQTIFDDTYRIPPTIQKFTSGTGTYTKPSGVKYLRVRLVGGGGGGSGGGTSGGTGGTGGGTTFGTLTGNPGFSAGQGAGGALGGIATIGAGFTGTAQRGEGTRGITTGGTTAQGSKGGTSPFGGNGTGSWSTGTASAALANSGSGGGGGGATASLQGAQGGSSGGYIDAITEDPADTYSYGVGAGGTAGAAGTSGGLGGVGGSGYIIVEEYYQ